MRSRTAPGEAIRDPAAGKRADEPTRNQNTASKKPRTRDGDVESPVEHGRQPEGIRCEYEIEHGLREDRSPERWDAHQVDESSGAGVGRAPDGNSDFLHASTQRLAHREGEEGEDQPGQRGHEKGAAPTEMVGYVAAPSVGRGDAEHAASAPDRHHRAALLLRDVVGDEGGPSRVIAGLTDPHRRTAQKQMNVVRGEPREQGGQTPDRHPDPDHSLAHSAVSPIAERKGGDRIDEQKGGGQEPDLRVAQVELRLDGRHDGGANVAIQIIQEVDGDHHREDVAAVSSRHGAILWAVTLPESAIAYDYLSLSGSAGHWRAQVAVNHPRKLWGFKSLPAHQPRNPPDYSRTGR